jgi:hypothetical protein
MTRGCGNGRDQFGRGNETLLTQRDKFNVPCLGTSFKLAAIRSWERRR